MPMISGTHYCTNCKHTIDWYAYVKEKHGVSNASGIPNLKNIYEAKVISEPNAKIHVLYIVCAECGQIDIIKQENRNIHNPYISR